MNNKLQKQITNEEVTTFSFGDIINSTEIISIGYPKPTAGIYEAKYCGTKQVKYSSGTEKSKAKCGVIIVLEINGQQYYDKLNMFDEEGNGRKGPEDNPTLYQGLFNKLIVDICKQWDVTPTGKALVDNIGSNLKVQVGKFYNYNVDKMTTESETATTTTEVPTNF